MKPTQRDELLGRLDERSLNTWQTVEKIEKHVDRLNGAVAKNTAFRVWGWRIILILLLGGGSTAGILKGIGLF